MFKQPLENSTYFGGPLMITKADSLPCQPTAETSDPARDQKPGPAAVSTKGGEATGEGGKRFKQRAEIVKKYKTWSRKYSIVNLLQIISSWWFQPIWKIWVKMVSSSPSRDKNKKCLSCHHPDLFEKQHYKKTVHPRPGISGIRLCMSSGRGLESGGTQLRGSVGGAVILRLDKNHGLWRCHVMICCSFPVGGEIPPQFCWYPWRICCDYMAMCALK